MKRYYRMRGGKILVVSALSFVLIPHILFFTFSKSKPTIKKDVYRWLECTIKEHHWIVSDLLYLLVFVQEFRNVFYLRLGRKAMVLKYLRPLSSLYINTKSENFGAGTFIQHGFSTVITAEKIGENCWINQQVTIGFNGSRKYGFGRPTIGDRVRISAGAKVCGKVIIGDDSTIGMNAVVVKDVPPQSVVIPSPMFLIRENGNETYKQL